MNTFIPARKVEGLPPEVNHLLILDFDGVLNQLPSYRDNSLTEDEVFSVDNVFNATSYDRSFRISVSNELIERLNVIISDPSVQLVWATTWEEHVLNAVKNTPLVSPVHTPIVVQGIYRPTSDLSSIVWKIWETQDFIDRVDASELSLIWADDHVIPAIWSLYEQTQDWIETHFERFVLIGPNAGYGITRADMASIEKLVFG